MQMHAKKIHIIKQIPYHNIKSQLQSTKGSAGGEDKRVAFMHH